MSTLHKNIQIFADSTTDVDIPQYEENEIRFVVNDVNRSSTDDINADDDYDSISMLSYDDSVNVSGFDDSSEPLHPYTNIATDEYCERIAYAFRKAHLSKKEHRVFLDLIREALPFPNSLPSNMRRLLSLIQVKDNLFEKKKICVLCRGIISVDTGLCSLCLGSNEAKTAFVYNSNIKFLLSLLFNKYWDDICHVLKLGSRREKKMKNI